MKKFFSLLLLLGAAIALRAQNYNNQPAEIFIEIADAGRHTVTLNDEYTGSANNRFRFFEVEPGSNLLIIGSKGTDVFNDTIVAIAGKRLIFRFSEKRGLQQVKLLDIFTDNNYSLDNWDGYLIARNNPQAETRPQMPAPRNRRTPVMEQPQFAKLLVSMRNEVFDDNKAKIFRLAFQGYRLSVNQLCEALKEMSWDKGKIDIAFFAYDRLVDPQNFYLVRDNFIFLSSTQQFDKFVSTH